MRIDSLVWFWILGAQTALKRMKAVPNVHVPHCLVNNLSFWKKKQRSANSKSTVFSLLSSRRLWITKEPNTRSLENNQVWNPSLLDILSPAFETKWPTKSSDQKSPPKPRAAAADEVGSLLQNFDNYWHFLSYIILRPNSESTSYCLKFFRNQLPKVTIWWIDSLRDVPRPKIRIIPPSPLIRQD